MVGGASGSWASSEAVRRSMVSNRGTDTERPVLIKKSSRFPMIPLEPVNGKPFHFVVPAFEDDKNLQLRNSNKPHLIKMLDLDLDLDPDAETGAGLFRRDRRVSKKTLFIRTRDDTVLEWIGELKPTHSSRVAHGLGKQLTRIGLDESEWLQENSDSEPTPLGMGTAGFEPATSRV